MNMRRTCEATIILILLLATVSGAYAQQSTPPAATPNTQSPPAVAPGPRAPDSAQILLPSVVLKVPDISAATVNPLLPRGQTLSIPDAGVPLPDTGALHIPEQAFNVPLPGRQTNATASVRGTSLYNTGVIGVGSMNHIVGSLSLYKLGVAPQLRLHFFHEGLDGFAGKPAGTGFFTTSNVLSGALSTGDSRLGTDSQASFQDEAFGLQDQSSAYYSVGVRTMNGSMGLRYKPSNLLSFGARIEADAASRLYTVAGPAPAGNSAIWAYNVAPSLSAGLTIENLDLQLRGLYNLRLTDGLSALNTANLGLYADATLPADFLLKANFGAFWTIGTGFLYPFSIDLAKSFGSNLSFNLSGGFSVTPQSFTDLWTSYPLLHVGDSVSGALANSTAWFGSAGFSLSTQDLLFTTQGSVRLSYREHVVDVTGYDSASSSYLYVQNDYLTLQPQLRVTWSPVTLFSLSAGMQGNLLQKATQEPLVSADFNISASGPRDRFGGGITGRFNIFDVPDVPNLSANMFVRLTDGVELDLDAADLLSPLIPGGRPVIGAVQNANFPFYAPGFRVTLSTHISL